MAPSVYRRRADTYSCLTTDEGADNSSHELPLNAGTPRHTAHGLQGSFVHVGPNGRGPSGWSYGLESPVRRDVYMKPVGGKVRARPVTVAGGCHEEDANSVICGTRIASCVAFGT